MTDLHQLRKRSPCRLPGYKEAYIFILLLGFILGSLFLPPPEAEANLGNAPTMDQLSGVYEATAIVVRDDPNWPISVTIGQELSVRFSMGLYSEDHGQMTARFRSSVPDVPFTYDYSTNTAVGTAGWAMGNHCRSESSFSYNDGEFYYEVKNFCTQSPNPAGGNSIVHGYWKEMPGYTIRGTAFFDGESYVIEAEDANVEYRFVLVEPINLVELNPGLVVTIPDQENEVVENGTIDDDPEELQLPLPADTTFPPDNDSPVIPPLDDYSGEGSDYDSSPAGLSKIPPPENAGQAMAGLLIPGIISIILGILGQSGAAVSPSGGSGSSKAKAGSAYDFGDGRDYYEGQSYTFDNGKKYKIDNGEFVPTAGLRDGEGYTDPDGNRKIWVGGQPWYEADWRRQAATNDAYTKAHKQDVDSYWDKRQQEIHEEQAALHEKDEAEKAKDREIEAEREKVKELIRKTIEIQMDIDRTRRDIANRSAALADRIYRSAEAIKYVCDKSIDIAAKIPGPKGEAFKAIRKAYRVTSAMAGGVGEGMASGNWTDSMVDATGAAVSNFIEDSIKTDRYKKGFEVFRGGTGAAWQQGRKAYKKGESIAGAAATGFVEGAASEASKKAKEALEELAPGSKYSYTIGESAFKAGYKEYKKGGDIGDVMRASGSGYVDGGIDAAMDYGVGKIFDNVLPENVSEKTLADHIKYIEELEEQGIWMELYDTNRFPELKEMLQEDFTPEIIYEKIKEEANKVVTKAATKVTQNVVKGKPFDDKLFS